MSRPSFLKLIKTGFLYLLNKKPMIKVEHLITYRCNLKCISCGLYKQKGKELRKEEIKQLMKKFSDKGLHPDIKEVVACAKSLGLHMTMSTNGLLIQKNVAWLKDIDLIGLSIDGPKQIHEKIRGKNTYDNVIKNLQLMKKNKLNVYINTLLSNFLLEQDLFGLKEMLSLAVRTNTPIAFLPIFKDQYNTVDELVPKTNEFKHAILMLKRFKKKNPALLMISNKVLKIYAQGIKEFNCIAGKHFCTLYPNGKISPCRFKQSQDKKTTGGKCCCSTLCYLEYNRLFKHPFANLKNLQRY